MSRPALLAALAATFLVAVASPGHEPAADLRLAAGETGAVRLSTSREDAAVLTASALAPGGAVAGDLDVRNDGDGDGSLVLRQSPPTRVPGPRGGTVADRLQLSIDVNVDGRPEPVYAGSLAAFASADLGRLGAGDGRRFRFRVALPPGSGDEYQGAATSVRYEWTAVGAGATGSAEPAPAPAPSGPDVAPAATSHAAGREQSLTAARRAPSLRVISRLAGRRLRLVARRGERVAGRCTERCAVSAVVVAPRPPRGVPCLEGRLPLSVRRAAVLDARACVIASAAVRLRAPGAVRITARPPARVRRMLTRRSARPMKLVTVATLNQPSTRIVRTRRFAGRAQAGGR